MCILYLYSMLSWYETSIMILLKCSPSPLSPVLPVPWLRSIQRAEPRSGSLTKIRVTNFDEKTNWHWKRAVFLLAKFHQLVLQFKLIFAWRSRLPNRWPKRRGGMRILMEVLEMKWFISKKHQQMNWTVKFEIRIQTDFDKFKGNNMILGVSSTGSTTKTLQMRFEASNICD